MKYYSIEDIIKDIRVVLDQNMSSEALSELGDIDTLSLDELIRSKIEDAALAVIKAAPISKLGDITERLIGSVSISDSERHVVRVKLPKDFARLVRFKMKSWPRAVYGAEPPISPYYEQANSEFGILGTRERPVVFLVPSPVGGGGLQIEAFCAVSKEDEEDGCLYVSIPKIVQGDILVTNIALDKSELTIGVGGEETLNAYVYPSDATNKELAWESDDEEVATVDDGVVTGVGEGTCTITCSSTDGSDVSDECEVTVSDNPDPDPDPDPDPEPETHEYVDLGLPSGTLWATCNVGASSPEDAGDYFAWGETTQKESYRWDNYEYCDGSMHSMTKYNTDQAYGIVDNKTELEAEDDAAHVNWGENWRTPSYEQMLELVVNCDYQEVTQNGIKGYLFVSKANNNSIFLPCARGYVVGNQDSDEFTYQTDATNGFYWTRDSINHLARMMRMITNISYLNFFRACGASVRPVYVPPTPPSQLRPPVPTPNSRTSGESEIALGKDLVRPTVYYAAALTALAIKDGDAATALKEIAKDILEN